MYSRHSITKKRGAEVYIDLGQYCTTVSVFCNHSGGNGTPGPAGP
jgi:hypothetical protein